MSGIDKNRCQDKQTLLEALQQAGADVVAHNQIFCPFHQHHHDTPSGSIYSDDGHWRYKCFSCGFSGDVFDVERRSSQKPAAATERKQPRLKRFANYDAAKAFYDRTLNRMRYATTYNYTDANGITVYYKLRYELHNSEGCTIEKTYRYIRPVAGGYEAKQGHIRPLYNLPGIVNADSIVIVEGEKAADSLIHYGIPATTSGGNKTAAKAHWEPLKNKNVIIWPDHDEAGRQYAAEVIDILLNLNCKISEINPPDLDLQEGEDAADLVQQLVLLYGQDINRVKADVDDALAKAKPVNLAQLRKESLSIICASQIQEEELRWLWDNRFPEGMYSFIVGDPGAGKSFLSCYMAATVSTGGLWADGSPCQCGRVLMFSSEDHLAKTIIPRLKAHEANLSMVDLCQYVRTEEKDRIPFVIQEHTKLIEDYVSDHPDCRLIILDPITGYMGDADQNSQGDVRELLLEMVALAERTNIAIIGISHINKKTDLEMQYRSIGSIAFNAVPRAVWGILAKKSDEETDEEEGSKVSMPARRFFFPIKDNLCVEPTILEFYIVNGRIIFRNQLTKSDFNRLTKTVKKKEKRLTKKEEAKQIILATLKDCPLVLDTLIAKVTDAGISEQTAKDAARELRAAKKVDCGKDGETYKWRIL